MAQGMMLTAPWKARGVKLSITGCGTYKQAFPFYNNTDSTDIVGACADFYLLEAVRYGLVIPVRVPAVSQYAEFLGGDKGYNKWADKSIAKPKGVTADAYEATKQQADTLHKALVAKYAVVLREYMHFAIAGELNYHKAYNAYVQLGYNNGADGYGIWRKLCETIGYHQAARDAAVLFRDGGWGGGYGGEPWAAGADILALYEEGKLPDSVFIDRVWSLQHNTGSMLNKVGWQSNKSGFTVESMNTQLLPAHGASVWTTLLKAASKDTQAVWTAHLAEAAKLNGFGVDIKELSETNIYLFNAALIKQVFCDGDHYAGEKLMKPAQYKAHGGSNCTKSPNYGPCDACRNFKAVSNVFEARNANLAHQAAKKKLNEAFAAKKAAKKQTAKVVATAVNEPHTIATPDGVKPMKSLKEIMAWKQQQANVN